MGEVCEGNGGEKNVGDIVTRLVAIVVQGLEGAGREIGWKQW